MKKVITYGTYDLLHEGHIRLLKRAKKLGDYLIVGVTSDLFDKNRGKMNVRQSLSERIIAIKETGLADQIIVEEYEGQKISDIIDLNIDIFTVGSDWIGKFDYLKNYCEVVYLDRTEGVSSTALRNSAFSEIVLGIVGVEVPVERMIEEIKYVSGIRLSGIYLNDKNKVDKIKKNNSNLLIFSSAEELLKQSNAVYIAVARDENKKYIDMALEYNCHVLCESPMFLNSTDTEILMERAENKKLVLMEALKTRYFPAFQHMILLLRSGIIGTILDIDVSCSQFPDSLDINNKYFGSIYDFGSYAALPINSIFGKETVEIHLRGEFLDEFCRFLKGELLLTTGTATFKLGKGIKTEGNMIITGTEGYIYVPAPWWKTDYFEVRTEDLRNTKKYFYKFEGEGLRYEVNEFVKRINTRNYLMSAEEKNGLWLVSKLIETLEHDIIKDKLNRKGYMGSKSE